MRTRIKICGLTREQDVLASVAAGVDALGFVFYPESTRAVSAERARHLIELVPPFVTTVGLFVNADPNEVKALLGEVPLGLLQFHGDEEDDYCAQFARPYIKAARVREGVDLIDYAASFPKASGLLFDAWVDGFGGGGVAFDWRLIPVELARHAVLAGGLNPANVEAAVRAVKPFAVDVSSGVEVAKGIKDAALIEAFVAGVRHADGRTE
jgi:phosphoribosylanthranilate isomerase